MKAGEVILVPFPIAEQTDKKLRPAVVIAETQDKYKDIIVAAISSVIPHRLSKNEIIIVPTRINGLRTKSVIKVDRVVTLKRRDIVAKLGKLTKEELAIFKKIFQSLID